MFSYVILYFLLLSIHYTGCCFLICIFVFHLLPLTLSSDLILICGLQVSFNVREFSCSHSKEVDHSRAAVDSSAGCTLHKSDRCPMPGHLCEAYTSGVSQRTSPRGHLHLASMSCEILFVEVNVTSRLSRAHVPTPPASTHWWNNFLNQRSSDSVLL